MHSDTLTDLHTDPGGTHTAPLDAAGSLDDALTFVAERAATVDAGDGDARPALRELGRVGLLDFGLPGGHGHGTLADQATVVRSLARVCTATAFSTWAHRTALGFLAGWGGPSLLDSFLEELACGHRTAATAMATAFQAHLGLGELTVTATHAGDRLVLDGVIPWASNLFADGAVVVLPAHTDDDRRVVVAITTDQPGVALAPYPPLLALSATASTTLHLDGVTVEVAQVLTDRFEEFLDDVRPRFLLLQTALALGLADAALDAAAPRLTGPAELLGDDHTSLRATLTRLDAFFTARLAEPAQADASLVRLRLEASEVAVAATRHEATATGGAGYLASSATARRLREASFLPIQSPTEAQLRWELTHSG